MSEFNFPCEIIELLAGNNHVVFELGVEKAFEESFMELDGTLSTYRSYKSPVIESGCVLAVMGVSYRVTPEMLLYESLTPQQKRLCQLLCCGLTSKLIARELNLSYRTIEHYLAALKEKFASSTIQALTAKLARCIHC